MKHNKQHACISQEIDATPCRIVLKNHHYKVKNNKACCQKYWNNILTCNLSNKFVFEIDLTILKSHEK